MMHSQVPIDEIDAAILTNLLRESRTSFTKIARECKISVTAVTTRYNRLWKEGIIKGEVMLVNPFNLGYRCVALIGVTGSKENEAEMLRLLESLPSVPIEFGKFAKYSAITVVTLKDFADLTKIQRKIEANPAVKRADAFIFSTEIAAPEHPENLILKPASGRIKHKPIKIETAKLKIDETDRKIARILTHKSRQSFRKIAEEVGITTKTVIQRYRKLKGTVLSLSTIAVDPNKLGYTAAALMFVKLEKKGMTEQVVDKLLKIPNVIYLNNYVGPYDLLVHVIFKNFAEYFKMMESINNISGIYQLEISLVPIYPVWPPNLFAHLL